MPVPPGTGVAAGVVKYHSKRVAAFSVFACAWPALLFATVCLIPFLNEPYRIDDGYFLTMAKQVAKHPMHPMDFDVCWNTIEGCTKAYALTPGNALMGYVLLPTVLTGAHEWTAHLTQLLLVWIAVIAMASLMLRFGWDRWHATAGTLLLVAIPPFLPMASTAMPDILATALALVAMERLAAWKAEQRWSQGAAAAIALALAGYARSHLVLLLPLAAFFLLVSLNPREIAGQIRQKWWLGIPVFAGCGLLLTIIFAVREHNLAITPPAPSMIRAHLRINVYAYLLYFAFPLPLAACWVANRISAGRLRSVLILIAVAAAPFLFRWNLALVLLLAVLGLCVLANLLFKVAKGQDHFGAFLMLWILIPLPIVYYSHLPMKYLLPCMPAVILLCFRLLNGVSAYVARRMVVGLIVSSMVYSLLIVHSDAEFAEFGRDALYQLIRPHVAAGETVWYPGQYWSYWYAPLAGARLTYPGGPQPQPGDLLVSDLFADSAVSPLKRFPHRTLVETIHHKYSFGRTMGAGIGLYANGSGFWLWGFGQSDQDRFELWRID